MTKLFLLHFLVTGFWSERRFKTRPQPHLPTQSSHPHHSYGHNFNMCHQCYIITACLKEDPGERFRKVRIRPSYVRPSTGNKESLQFLRKSLSTTWKKTLTPDILLKRKIQKQQCPRLYFSLSPSASGNNPPPSGGPPPLHPDPWPLSNWGKYLTSQGIRDWSVQSFLGALCLENEC